MQQQSPTALPCKNREVHIDNRCKRQVQQSYSRSAVTNINAFLLADLAPNGATKDGRPQRASPPVQEAQQESAKATVFANSFCVLAELIARQEIRQQACEEMRCSQKQQTSQHRSSYDDLQMVQSLKQLQRPLLQSLIVKIEP